MTTNFSQSSPDRENQTNQTSPPSDQVHFSSKLLARNTIYNIMGRALPMIVAFFTIPQVIKGLGVESFGVLSLVWVVIGYFGIFDLGIGRATVKYVAEAVFHKEFDQLSSLFWTSLLLLVGFGLIGGALLSLFVPLLVNHIFNIPESLKHQSEISFFILAATMPFIIGSSGVRGTLEGQHRFDLINIIKIPASIITFVSPLIVLLFTDNLIYIVAVLACNRVLSFSIYLIFCVRLLPHGKKPKLSEKTMIKKLFQFG
ncbi:MAG: oligosaccharide flippase family protein, partial [FCB group bacterium]|nr:oligosaccharide flippase family protein [FCB group bacterium]